MYSNISFDYTDTPKMKLTFDWIQLWWTTLVMILTTVKETEMLVIEILSNSTLPG